MEQAEKADILEKRVAALEKQLSLQRNKIADDIEYKF